MQLSKFLQAQGVLEATNWVFLGAKVSGDGKTLIGTAFPLGSDYWQGFRVDLDQVFVCHGAGQGKNGGTTSEDLRVDFPKVMNEHLSHGDKFGLCRRDAPL